jgi:putative SbcD/Mre11-related phosphoesterase
MRRWIEVAPGLRLTGDGAAWLPRAAALIVADVHVGYELAAQRRGGYLPPVQRGTFVGARLAAMMHELSATRLVIAGDLRHSTNDLDDFERAELVQLAAALPADTALDVVVGNHDRGGSIVGRSMRGPMRVGDADICHVPPTIRPSRWTVCGHLHPRVSVRDETGASARYPCALVGENVVVLPAFSDWAGGASAARLIASLPPGEWRALPVSGGHIADLGIALGRSDRPMV